MPGAGILEAMSALLLPYNPVGVCHKCGGDVVSTCYHRPERIDCSYDSRRPCGIDREHLRRSCQRCGHYWNEAVIEWSE